MTTTTTASINPINDPPRQARLDAGLMETAGGKPTVLIVDDEEANRKNYRMDLEEAGFEVIEAADGREALAKLDGNPGINAILTDFDMPVLDGLKMAAKAKESRTGIPIVMLSADTGLYEMHEQVGSIPNIDHFFTKPVKFFRDVVPVMQRLTGLTN